MHTYTYINICTYSYIYIFFLRKNKTGHIRIINLFPSCYVFFCPDGIPPNSGLTGPNNHIYIYIYIYVVVFR